MIQLGRCKPKGKLNYLENAIIWILSSVRIWKVPCRHLRCPMLWVFLHWRAVRGPYLKLLLPRERGLMKLWNGELVKESLNICKTKVKSLHSLRLDDSLNFSHLFDSHSVCKSNRWLKFRLDKNILYFSWEICCYFGILYRGDIINFVEMLIILSNFLIIESCLLYSFVILFSG